MKSLVIVSLLLAFSAPVAAKPRITGGNQQPVVVSITKPPTGGNQRPVLFEWWPLECWFHWPWAMQSCEVR